MIFYSFIINTDKRIKRIIIIIRRIFDGFQPLEDCSHGVILRLLRLFQRFDLVLDLRHAVVDVLKHFQSKHAGHHVFHQSVSYRNPQHSVTCAFFLSSISILCPCPQTREQVLPSRPCRVVKSDLDAVSSQDAGSLPTYII